MASSLNLPSDLVHLPVSSVLMQISQVLAGSANVEITVSRETTPAAALAIASESVRHNHSPCVLLRNRRNPAISQGLWERATAKQAPAPAPLTIRTSHNQPLPDISGIPKRQINREAMETMIQRAEAVMDKDPYVINLAPWIVEDSLIALPSAKFVFAGIGTGIDDPVAHVVDALCIWDSGCHITTLSADILSEDFFRFLRGPAYSSYHKQTGNGESWLIAVDGYLTFSNTNLEISFVAKVVPRSRMPNNFSGILLGQIAVLDSLECHSIPRSIIEAEGAVLGDNVWGELAVRKYIDAVTGVVIYP